MVLSQAKSSLSFSLLLTTLVLAFSSLITSATASSSVLGIDLGTEYIKGALVKPGNPFDIVLSKDSKRKEASAIAFKPGTNAKDTPGSFPERFYGGDAVALASRFPGDVYLNLKGLLGRGGNNGLAGEGTDDGISKVYQQRYPQLDLRAAVFTGDEEGRTGFKSGCFGEGEPEFLVEELLAMELKNLKENAEMLAGKGHKVNDAVITVPPFYTAEEKAAVETAADLAGLNLLGLVSDGLAVGLNYATTRNFPVVSDGERPEYHMVFDMGAGSTTATVMKFQGKTVKDVGRFNKTIQEVVVLGSGWDRLLGGDQLNSLIIDDMVAQFVQSSEAKAAGVTVEQIKSHGRAMAKLWKDSERIRQVLSANSEASTSLESFYNDLDFRYKINRADFEKLTSDFATRIEGPVKQALATAGLSFQDLDSVILHGGAVRTPFVRKKLESVAGSAAAKLRSSVNADEAAVFGAAFKGASLSPSFRAKEIRSSDAASYTYGVSYADGDKEREQNLFKPSSQAGVLKTVPFKQRDDFTMQLYESISSGINGRDKEKAQVNLLLSVETKNLTASVKQLVDKAGCASDDILTQFAIQLDSYDGLPVIVSGQVSCETAGEGKGSVVDDVKGFFGFGAKKDDQIPMQAESEDGSAAVESGEKLPLSEGTEDNSSKKEEKVSEKAAEPVVSKKRPVTVNVGFKVTQTRKLKLSESEMKRIKERIAAFDTSDKSRRLREEKLNTLEAFAYRVRDMLDDSAFIAASTSDERSSLEKSQSEVSEWISGDGAHADVDVLKAKYKELKGLVDPVEFRKGEAERRPEMIQVLQDQLSQTKNAMGMMEASIQKAKEDAEAAAAESVAQAEKDAADSAGAASPSADSDGSPSGENADDNVEENSTSSSSSVPMATSEPILYSPEDIADLSAIYDSITTWLADKESAQDKLPPNADPVLLAKDIEAKAKELNDAAVGMIQRKIRAQQQRKNAEGSWRMKSKYTGDTKTKAGAKEEEKKDEEEKKGREAGPDEL